MFNKKIIKNLYIIINEIHFTYGDVKIAAVLHALHSNLIVSACIYRLMSKILVLTLLMKAVGINIALQASLKPQTSY